MAGKGSPLERLHAKYLKSFVEQRHGYLRKTQLTEKN